MRDISLHVLDIVMNSVAAKANKIEINLIDDEDIIKLIVKDNGCGMKGEQTIKLRDPFYTTRKTRKVGLGVPLLYQNVKNTGGDLKIASEENVGTEIEAIFHKKHIDCIPLGNMKETLITLIQVSPEVNYLYTYQDKFAVYELNTIELKEILKEIPINHQDVIEWLNHKMENYKGGFKC